MAAVSKPPAIASSRGRCQPANIKYIIILLDITNDHVSHELLMSNEQPATTWIIKMQTAATAQGAQITSYDRVGEQFQDRHWPILQNVVACKSAFGKAYNIWIL